MKKIGWMLLTAAMVFAPAPCWAKQPKDFHTKVPAAATAQKNKVDSVVKQANRPTLTGVIKVTKSETGFIKATLKAEDGKVYTIANPAIVEDKDGQTVKVVVGTQPTTSEKAKGKGKGKKKATPKADPRTILVDEVQAAR